ncbi:macrophage mannose receptor 1-like [Saccostrea cucullata]|uniref:macrophage mannose receptor 1-like n=1 Tax=Saccostrea cuccullata TaxID=36930 RepID=UPI002ED110BF
MKRTGSDELVTTARYTPVRSGGCPSGFVESPINNKCYKIVQDSRLNFRQAKYSCSVLGKDFSLVSIHSAMENAFIELQFDTTKSKNLWIGLFDNNYYYDKRYFIWMDNSRVDFTNWARGEPNSLTEGCAEMRVKDGSWNSISCFLNRSYICQTNKALRYPTQAAVVSSCPSGYTSSAGSCFRVIDSAMDFNAAQATCQVDGASLASINSAYEQMSIEIISKNIPGALWIGLRHQGDVHFWLDGWPYRYSKWAAHEPTSKPGENCTVLINTEWKDTQCDLKYPSICEYTTVDPPTTPRPGKCPPDSSKFQRHCYFVEPNGNKTRPEAKAACIARNMTLVTFRNLQEVEHVRQLSKFKGGNNKTRLWIGLYKSKPGAGDDLDDYGEYDFTMLTILFTAFWWDDDHENFFDNWNNGEPSGAHGSKSELCVEMLDTGKFNDINCDNYYRGYACYGPEEFETTVSMAKFSTASTSPLYTTQSQRSLSGKSSYDVTKLTPEPSTSNFSSNTAITSTDQPVQSPSKHSKTAYLSDRKKN